MKTQVPVPTVVIERVTNQIQKDYPTLTQDQKTKLFSKLVEFWFYIYTEHQKEIQKLSASFGNEHLFNVYTHIHRSKLAKYRVKIGGKLIQYPELIKVLQSLQLVDINDTYSAGRFSKSYRTSPTLRYEMVQMIELDLSKLLINNKTREQLLQENPNHTKLINDLYLVKVHIDNFFLQIDFLIGSVYKWEKGEAKVLTPEHAYALKIRAIKINLGIHFFSVACTGRIYSSLANLPKLTLPFITLNGKVPMEIDAANCQPLLLASLLNHSSFKSDCESGIFYDKMAEHLGLTRQEFKIKSYAQIFFNNKKISKEMSETLDQVYPNLSEQINEWKAKSKKAAQAMDKVNLLWHKLQSLEASVFVKTALEQMRPVFTRHDSIVCTPEDFDSISKAIKKRFKEIGIKVTLK